MSNIKSKYGYSFWFNDKAIIEYELIKSHAHNNRPSWVINDPAADCDVVFMSKKEGVTLKVNQTQFKQTIPLPIHSKVSAYLKKLKVRKSLS